MATVYISYSRQDYQFVERLYAALRAADIATWVDFEGISPSAAWADEIQAAMGDADTFIFVLSPDAIHSEWCKRELSYALSLKKRIISVVVRPISSEDTPPPLVDIQWFSFIEPNNFDVAVHRLIKSLGQTESRVGRVAPARGRRPEYYRFLTSWRVILVIAFVVLGVVTSIAHIRLAVPEFVPQLYSVPEKIKSLITPLTLLTVTSLAMNLFLGTLLVRARSKSTTAETHSTSGLIFISYSRSDSDFVDKIEEDLLKEGFKTWVDRRRLEGGQIWDAKIVDAIKRSQIVLVILSPDALRSPWVRKEYAYAMKQGKTLVPMIYHPCPLIPRRLARFQHLDFQAGLNFEAKYRFRLGELIAALDAFQLPRAAAA